MNEALPRARVRFPGIGAIGRVQVQAQVQVQDLNLNLNLGLVP